MVKTFKIAGIFGVLLIALSLIVFLFYFITLLGMFSDVAAGRYAIARLQENALISTSVLTIIGLVSSLLSIGFLYGFVALGKRFDNKMLIITGWVFIVFTIITIILTGIFYMTGDLYPTEQELEANSSILNIFKQRMNQIPVVGTVLNILGGAIFWPLAIVFILGKFILHLMFGIGLIKLNKKGVPSASWAGWFEIISIFISSLNFFALIFETVMFFRASSKFENSLEQNKPDIHNNAIQQSY